MEKVSQEINFERINKTKWLCLEVTWPERFFKNLIFFQFWNLKDWENCDAIYRNRKVRKGTARGEMGLAEEKVSDELTFRSVEFEVNGE